MTEVVAVGGETTQPGVNIGIDVLGEIEKRVLWFSTGGHRSCEPCPRIRRV
jgi:hypothetical protein